MNWLSKKFIWLWSWLINSPWKFICSWVDWFEISLCGWIHWTFHVQNHFWNLIIYIFVCQVRFFFKFSSSKIVFKPNFIIFSLKLAWVLILNYWIKILIQVYFLFKNLQGIDVIEFLVLINLLSHHLKIYFKYFTIISRWKCWHFISCCSSSS